MNGSTDLAVRDSAALSIQTGQTAWDKMQLAALGQLGLKDAPEGDLSVFLHVSQRTGLDPFAKQIYMIGRNEKKNEKRNGQWVETWTTKYTIQTGIEGFRVIRSRAEREEGVRGILGRPVFYDRDMKEYKVWVRPQPPAAVEMTYTVRDRNGIESPYTSILQFSEYVQTKEDNKGQRVAIAQWATKPTHMLEKCVEADVYRKAFPQDFSGVALEDAMPLPDPDDGPPVQPQRQRVTAEQARARSPQTVTATVVTPHVPPAGEQPAPPAAASAPPEEPAGGTASPEQVKAIWSCLNQDYGFTAAEKDQARAAVAIVAGQRLESVSDLAAAKASQVLDQLHEWRDQARQTGERPRDILAADIASRDADPRDEDGTVPGE